MMLRTWDALEEECARQERIEFFTCAKQGMRAAKAGAPLETNPHSRQNERSKYDAWHAGWWRIGWRQYEYLLVDYRKSLQPHG
jgi:hypothetical protein